MNNDLPKQERIFKIFTPVRCLSRDQLPRYLNGNMTDWEKHLIEQHLVDCDLCHDAMISLQTQKNLEPYERLSKQMSLYLQREYSPVVQQSSQQKGRTRQSGQTRENLLSYFWVIMFLMIGGGSIFLLQQHVKNRPSFVLTTAKAADAVIVPPKSDPVSQAESTIIPTASKPPVIQTQYSLKDTSSKKPQHIKLTAKDSALLASKKKPVKDTLKKAPVTDTNTRIALQQAAPLKAEKETPPREEKTVVVTPPPAPKEKEDPKPEVVTATGDESLFKTAMLYQQQGDINEAINQFRKLSTNYQFSERAKYQLALCYRTKGQNAKARRLLKEVVRMEGSLKAKAQTELDGSN